MVKSTFLHLVRIALWAMVFALLGMGTFAKRGWLDWKRMEFRNTDLETQIQKARESKQSLERQVEALQSNPAEQERVIRQVLGYIRPQETVIEF